MSLRTVIFWTHLSLALCVGTVVLIMAATGVLLTWQPQIMRWADTRGMAAGPPSAAAQRLTTDTLLARVRAAESGPITGLRVHADPAAAVEVALGRERTLFLNAWTGAVLGSGSDDVRTFFRVVTDVHRWLGLNGEARRAGRAIIGAANLAFLFIVLSGLVLWWPRNRSARALRNVLLYRRGLRAKARDFNWHNVTGIWAALPLLLIIASGVVISYAWAGAIVARISASPPVAAPAAQATSPDSIDAALSMDQLFAIAERKTTGWRAITLQLPPRGGAYTFVIERGSSGQPQKRAVLTLSHTGRELGWRTFADQPRPERVRSVLRYLHTGEVAGAPGQLLAGLASAAALLLVWTGASLALRRFRSWRGRRTR